MAENERFMSGSMWLQSLGEFKKLNVPATGNDFFAESRRSIRKYVHPEDQDKALRLHYKDVMIANLKNHSSFSLAWRLVVNGKVVNIRHTELMSRDGKHIIVCIENIDAEVKAELELKENQKKSVTYTQIAERLADHYDLIYYIDCRNSNYIELSTKQKSGELNVQSEGDDFFGAAARNVDRFIYLEDRSRIRLFMDRDNLLTRLENRRQLTEDYRMITADGKIQYTRMSVVYSSDHSSSCRTLCCIIIIDYFHSYLFVRNIWIINYCPAFRKRTYIFNSIIQMIYKLRSRLGI